MVNFKGLMLGNATSAIPSTFESYSPTNNGVIISDKLQPDALETQNWSFLRKCGTQGVLW
jgi:hypothetical protein